MSEIQANPAVVAALLARYPFTGPPDLQHAITELTQGIQLSMQHTAAYNIALDQALPPEIGTDSAAPYVHPYNIASALVSVCMAAQAGVDPALQLYVPGLNWVPISSGQLSIPAVQVVLTAPAPAIPPAPPAAAVPPAIPAAPATPAPANDLVGLVDAALGGVAPVTVAATPVVPSAPPVHEVIDTPAKYSDYRDATGHPETRAVIEGTATRVAPAPAAAPPQHVTHAQAVADAAFAEAVGLPDASVLAERRSTSGRPQKSPFQLKVLPRNKVGAAPFWWPFLVHSSKVLFAENPAAALDPSSTGSGPVQAYALLLSLMQDALRTADGTLTVAELRAWLREVETGVMALPDAAAINQLVDHMYSTEQLKGE